MSDQNAHSPSKSTSGLDYLSNIIKSVSAPDPNETHDTETSEATQASQSPLMGELFSSIISNPELMAKLPHIISTVKPIIEMMGSSQLQPKAVSASADLEESTATAIAASKPIAEKKPGTDRREALLRAIKPYLSHDRCRAIDQIIKLSHLGELLKTL